MSDRRVSSVKHEKEARRRRGDAVIKQEGGTASLSDIDVYEPSVRRGTLTGTDRRLKRDPRAIEEIRCKEEADSKSDVKGERKHVQVKQDPEPGFAADIKVASATVWGDCGVDCYVELTLGVGASSNLADGAGICPHGEGPGRVHIFTVVSGSPQPSLDGAHHRDTIDGQRMAVWCRRHVQ